MGRGENASLGSSDSAWAGYWLGDLPPDAGDLRLLLRVPLNQHDHNSRVHPVAMYSLDQGGAKDSSQQCRL